MNNFWKRTFTGIAFVAILIGCIWFHAYSFYILFLLITIFASNEFYEIVERNGNIQLNKIGAIIASASLFTAGFCTVYFPLQLVYTSLPANLYFYIYGIIIAGLLICELYRKKENPLHNWAYLILGQVFVALPFTLLNFIVFPWGTFDPIFLLALFVIIWTNDTGAYIVGISFGKHRLFERISPKKSWEGFFGGTFFALILAFFMPFITGEMDIVRWLGFALIVVIFGTWGDLIESLTKRTVDIKDSGNILPGHGGLLDRFDSLLLAAPLIFIYLQIVL